MASNDAAPGVYWMIGMVIIGMAGVLGVLVLQAARDPIEFAILMGFIVAALAGPYLTGRGAMWAVSKVAGGES